MEKFSHTPGPWRVREGMRNDAETCDLKICGDIFVIADLNGPQYAHQMPNATLIAAAPELLEALRLAKRHIAHMARWIEGRSSGYSFEALGEDMPSIDAAIAKAMGE